MAPPLHLASLRPRFKRIFQNSVRPVRRAIERVLSYTEDSFSSTAPQVTLPIELLQIIFSMVMEPSCDDIGLAEKTAFRSTIFTCSQICRHWRAAAQGHGSLWVHAIDFQRHPIDVVQQLLRLSQQHCINIGHRAAPFRILTAKDVFVLSILKAHADRIGEWNVEYTETRAPHRWVFGPQSSSGLKTFRWKGTFAPSSDQLQPCQLPFPNSALRKLSLRDTNFPLSPLMNLDHLTELSMRNVKSPGLTLREWLDLLNKTSRLQFLSLHNAIALGGRQVSPAEPHVNLPDLRLVSLGDERLILPALALFPLLELSPFCGVEVSIPPADRDLALMAGFTLPIVQHHITDFMNDPDCIPRLELAIRPHSLQDKVVIGTVPDPEVNLDWNGPGGTKHVMEYLSKACSKFPPFSVGMQRPDSFQFTTSVLLSSFLLFATKMRITIDDPLVVLLLSPQQGSIPEVLKEMGHLKTLVLDEGAILSVLPLITGPLLSPRSNSPFGLHSYMRYASPFPILPELKFVLPENVDLDPGSLACRLLSGFMAWRHAVTRSIY